MAQVVTHTATALHQLHLFLVDAHNGTIRVGIAVEPYHKAVRQRGHLVRVADTRHWAARRNNVSEMVEQLEYLLCRKRIGIFLLHTGYLVGNAPVHHARTVLVNVAKTVFHGIFVHPNTGGQLIAPKIVERRGQSFVVRISLLRFH